MSSFGNTQDFGDLVSDNKIYPAGLSIKPEEYGVMVSASGSKVNTMCFVTITSTGDAKILAI